MTPNPASIFRELTSKPPVRLADLPDEHGIYALHDHDGAIRYVGITGNDRIGFKGRIWGRHVAGSLGYSHKFAQAYNTGRMWALKGDESPDAKSSRKLRQLFARRYCRATFVTLESLSMADLGILENSVYSIAPAAMLDWGRKRAFPPVPEPVGLVDALLDEERWSRDRRAAVARQAALNARPA